MAGTIAILGALDTKGQEYKFIKDCIESRGFKTFVIDTGVLGKPYIKPDIPAQQVAKAGGGDLKELEAKKDRGRAMEVMSRGISVMLPKLYEEGKFDGVIALGGTGGTSVACSGMRQLALCVPKLMVSTVAGTDVSGFVGIKDIVMFPSIVDVSGINKISREIFSRAAGAICGMVDTKIPKGKDKPLITASMFGNTTPCVTEAMKILENAGYEILVFHCTGSGGRTMESLIEAGLISAALDITTTEWADELVGGVFTAGPARLEAAAREGIAAVVVPGCLDMVNFNAPETVPEQFKDRKFYQHNPNVTLMRTNVEENQKLGEIIAEKLNLSAAPLTVLLPLKGLSMIDAPGGPFWWPEADKALFCAIKGNLRKDIPIIEMDCNINDVEFARCCAEKLIENIDKVRR